MSAREEILANVREALQNRSRVDHPGPFEGWRPGIGHLAPVDTFERMLLASGGEVVRRPTIAETVTWLAVFSQGFASVTVGATVPDDLRSPRPEAPADEAELGLSIATGAIAETGSLLMDARDGRRGQLLAPTHVVFVQAGGIHATFRDALLAARTDLPSAIGLHSGPSKSQDIGHVMVTGVHGPGRLIAVVMGS